MKVWNTSRQIIDWLWRHAPTHESGGVDALTLAATQVEVAELSTATYDDVQDYINFFGDRTLLSGGGITDNGNGTAAVASMTGWCKVSDSDTAVGRFFDWASPGNTAALTDLSINHIYVDYNGGTLQLVVSTDITTHGFKRDHIHIASIFRNGNTLHFHESDMVGIGRMGRSDMHHREETPAHRVSGLVTTDGGSLALSITAGVIYEGISRQASTVDGSTWSYWYTSDSGSSWTEDTSQSALVQSYNDITSGKVSLGTSKFGIHWVYVDIDGGHLHVVYGQGNYTANQAEEAGVPSVIPPQVTGYGVLIAKIINQEGTNTLTISYPWTEVFTSTLATDHGSLGGLSDDDHTQYIKDSEFTAADEIIVGTGSGTFGQVTLSASQFLAKKAAGAATNVTAAEAMAVLSGAAGAAFSFNSQNVSGIGTLETSGHLGVDTGPNANYGVYYFKNLDPTTTTAGVHGYIQLTVTDSSNSNEVYGLWGRVLVTGSNTQNLTAWVVGVGSNIGITTGASGTVTKMANFLGSANIVATTLTNRYGLYVNNATGAGTVTNQYGVYVAGMTKGGTLNYAIYTNAGLVHFGDAVDLTAGLTVGGNIIMATNKLTGLAAGTTSGDSVRYEQVLLNALLTTRGDIIYASGVSTPARLAKGTEGYVLTMGANDPAWSASSGGAWTLYETLSPSGVATVSTSTLDVHDLWMVIIDLTMTDDAETNLLMRLNGDSGANYYRRYIDNTTITTGTSTSLILGSGLDDAPITGIVYVGGKSRGDAGNVMILGGVIGWSTYNMQLNGRYDSAADITTMTFLGPTFTGKIKIYYMDY